MSHASYLAAARALGRQVVLSAQAESTREVVTILARRVAEGVAPEADLRKVETDLARLDTEATHVEIDLQANLAMLGALLGREAPVARSEIVQPDAAAWQVTPASQDAIAHLPEVEAAKQRATAAAAAYDLAKRQRWPDLLVSGGYKRTAGVDTAVVGVSVSVPVFNQGQREARARQRREAGGRPGRDRGRAPGARRGHGTAGGGAIAVGPRGACRAGRPRPRRDRVAGGPHLVPGRRW